MVTGFDLHIEFVLKARLLFGFYNSHTFPFARFKSEKINKSKACDVGETGSPSRI